MTNTLLTLHDPAAARRYYAQGLWRDDTFYTLLQKHAAERPEAPALRDATRRLSWAELLRAVDAVAADLDAAGLKRGERVAVWLPNRVEAVIVFLACSRQGYVCNPSLHQNYTAAEIVALLERTNAAALFAQPGYGADARPRRYFSPRRAPCPFCAKSIRWTPPLPRHSPPAPPHRHPPSPTPTRSSISPSPRARRGRPRASCIRPTRFSPMRGRWSPTGTTMPRRSFSR